MRTVIPVFALSAGVATAALAQGSASVAGTQSSRNIDLVARVQIPRVTDIEIEQELSRPYAYVSQAAGFQIINLKEPRKAYSMYTWQIENPELHTGGALGPMTLKSKGRYYFVQSYQYLRS